MSGYKLPMEVEATIQHQAGELMKLRQLLDDVTAKWLENYERLKECEKDRDTWRQKAIELGLELSECGRERDELVELLDHALSYTCCAAYSPSLTQEINAALAKLGADKTGEM